MNLPSISLLVAAFGTVAFPIAVSAISPIAPIEIAQIEIAPVARVNPDRPIQIRVENATSIPIRSRLTQPASAERTIAAGDSTSFGSTTTSYLPLPINLLVYPEQNNVGLALYVDTEENLVRVVIAAAASDTPGSTSMRIAPTGGIYIY
ncbi:MAG: hypothetical protein Kow00121_19880 [Elainellaceae cyanobacterium]